MNAMIENTVFSSLSNFKLVVNNTLQGSGGGLVENPFLFSFSSIIYQLPLETIFTYTILPFQTLFSSFVGISPQIDNNNYLNSSFNITVFHVYDIIKVLFNINLIYSLTIMNNYTITYSSLLTLYLIVFIGYNESGGMLNDIILGRKSNLINDDYKLFSNIFYLYFLSFILFNTINKRKEFCNYFNRYFISKKILESLNQFRLGLALCMDCMGYDLLLRQWSINNNNKNNLSIANYIVQGNQYSSFLLDFDFYTFFFHYLRVLFFVMNSMCTPCVISPYLIDLCIVKEKLVSLRTVFAKYDSSMWWYFKSCLFCSLTLFIAQDICFETNLIVILSSNLSISLAHFTQLGVCVWFVLYQLFL
ncbi:hypothetical protein ABK040_003401 [Willaertia magna]